MFYFRDNASERRLEGYAVVNMKAALRRRRYRQEVSCKMAVDEARATILVVEDETLIRMVSTEMLEDAGFRVIEAQSADEALKILEQAADVQLLFTDIRMPGSMDGLELAELVHRRWPNIRLLLTSGHRSLGETEVPDQGRFVPKPYSVTAVINQIQALLPSA